MFLRSGLSTGPGAGLMLSTYLSYVHVHRPTLVIHWVEEEKFKKCLCLCVCL